MFIQRRNALVPEDFQCKNIKDLFDTLKDEEMPSEDDDHNSEESDMEEEESDEEAGAIKDHFLDMNFDFVGNIHKAK
jgi:hypothetical protein